MRTPKRVKLREVGRLLKGRGGVSKIKPLMVALKLRQLSHLIKNLILPTVTTATPPTKTGRTVGKRPPRVVQR